MFICICIEGLRNREFATEDNTKESTQVFGILPTRTRRIDDKSPLTEETNNNVNCLNQQTQLESRNIPVADAHVRILVFSARWLAPAMLRAWQV